MVMLKLLMSTGWHCDNDRGGGVACRWHQGWGIKKGSSRFTGSLKTYQIWSLQDPVLTLVKARDLVFSLDPGSQQDPTGSLFDHSVERPRLSPPKSWYATQTEGIFHIKAPCFGNIIWMLCFHFVFLLLHQLLKLASAYLPHLLQSAL